MGQGAELGRQRQARGDAGGRPAGQGVGERMEEMKGGGRGGEGSRSSQARQEIKVVQRKDDESL